MMNSEADREVEIQTSGVEMAELPEAEPPKQIGIRDTIKSLGELIMQLAQMNQAVLQQNQQTQQMLATVLQAQNATRTVTGTLPSGAQMSVVVKPTLQ